MAPALDAAVDDQLGDHRAGVVVAVGDVLGREAGPDALAAQALAQGLAAGPDVADAAAAKFFSMSPRLSGREPG